VVDEKFQGVRGIGLFHLLFLLPWRGGIALENQMAVVMFGGGILHPQVARRDLTVKKPRVFANRGLISPCAAEGENTGRRAPVALFLGAGTGGDRMNA